MTTYFISDLHLHVAGPQNCKLFLEFLHTKAQHADALYILGDLFALWLGDDVELPKFPQVMDALKKISDRGIPVYFMHGNRDFLIGSQFAKATGCKILPDPYVINLYDQKILLTHGDQLCTLDHGYQRFRKFVQNSIIKRLFLSIPTTFRIKLGHWVKSKANRLGSNKQPALYDVNPQTVTKWLKQFDTPIMIHGHTHKPEVAHNRIVLGDWTNESAKILSFTAHDFSLIDLQKQSVPTGPAAAAP